MNGPEIAPQIQLLLFVLDDELLFPANIQVVFGVLFIRKDHVPSKLADGGLIVEGDLAEVSIQLIGPSLLFVQ